MGIRMLHRRTATARVDATATADTQVNPDAAPSGPLRAVALGAAAPRLPATPRTLLRDTTAPVRRRLDRLRDGTAWQLARGCADLALGALNRLPRPRTLRRTRRSLTVFIASADRPAPR
ncbi:MULTISPECIES: hypothetical protein [unclassified Streptomyces]|uniref:hypothetical protein n=1 Tax=unclassified Streptomyces TaxID=2593676 RepID=UPI003D748692